EHLDGLMTSCLEDFPDDDMSELADYTAGIAWGSITDRTRDGHARIIKAYIVFHTQRNTEWDATAVTHQTPYDIRAFITQKCGEKGKGYEGKQICISQALNQFSTAVSTCAALSYWYRHCRPNESVTEWRCDEGTGACCGLPTRARAVSEFMIGLEKMKARSGKVSQSARALLCEDMHHLNGYCMNATHLPEEQRWGVVRYAAYLFAWLMLLRIEEVVTLKFASVEVIPGEHRCQITKIRLKTRKSAQTGVLHTWRLWANDADPQLCPVQALICLACLYGPQMPLKGPLFLQIGKFGDILHDQPVVGAGG
ncbi:hypothetical protein EV702DRAFT_973228, partial [Suillus placidus]